MSVVDKSQDDAREARPAPAPQDIVSAGAALKAAGKDPAAQQSVAEKFGLTATDLEDLPTRALHDFGTSFGHVFFVATALVACCLVPALFLPRRKVAPVDPTVMAGH